VRLLVTLGTTNRTALDCYGKDHGRPSQSRRVERYRRAIDALARRPRLAGGEADRWGEEVTGTVRAVDRLPSDPHRAADIARLERRLADDP